MAKGTPQSEPGDVTAYGELLELTRDGVWRYDVVPSVSIRLPAEEQARLILSRARLGFCNPAFARMYGSGDPKDLVGLPLSNLLAGTDEEKLRFVAESVTTGYRFADVEAVTRDREGRTVRTLNNVAGVIKRGRLVGGWGTSRDISDEKAAEAALQDAHADLHATLAAFPDLVFEVDDEGRIFQYHAPDPAKLYATPVEFLGKLVSDVVPADAARVIHDALGEAARCGSHHGARYGLDLPSGHRQFELSMARKGPGHGSHARYVAIVRDVTAQEEAAASLRTSEERLALALDATSDGIYDVDFAMGVTQYSPRYATMLGYEPEELVPSQETWEGLLHPEDREEALRRLDECVGGAVDGFEMEFRLRTKSGDWRWILSRGRIVARDTDGKALRLVGTHRDIAGRVEAREALRRERDLAQLYLDVAEVMLVALDRDGTITLINRKGCAVLGRKTPEELLGLSWFSSCLPPNAASSVEAVFRKLMAGEVEAVEYYENPMLTASGDERMIAWHNAFLRDNEGHITGTLSSGIDVTDRSKAEDALQMSARVFEHSVDMLCVAGFDGYFKNLNPAWERTLGWSTGELLARPWIEFVHPDDRAATQEARSTLVDGQEVYQFENRYVCKDGSIKWLSWNSFPYLVEGIMFGVARDMTEARRADDAMRNSEEKYRLLVENAGEAVFVAQDGVLRFANPATARILGRELQSLVGRPFASLVHPDDRDMVVSRHLRRVSGEEEIEQGYTFRVIHGDGGVRWMELNSVRIEWEGRPATLNFAGDITDRFLVEAALRESEERFRRIFEESSIGMVTVSLDRRFTRANEAFCRMLGYTETELLQKTFVDITHPDHQGADAESVRRVARGEIPSYQTEKRYVRKDGRVVWGAATASAMRDAEGHIQYLLAMVEDITARRESVTALEESERRFRELADALPTCVFEAQLDGRLTYANRTGLEWFGYAEDEIVGSRSVFDMVAPEQRDVAARTLRAAAETGGVPAGEYTAVRKDGTTFPALVSSRAIERDGKTIGVRGVLIDVRERVEAAQQMERALTGTIHALALTTEMRDPYTAGHQARVARLATAIGRKLGLSDDRVESLRVAGLMHDVGKVSVPAEILSKPTGLSIIEMGLVRPHAEAGYAILREIDFPWPVAAIVLQHHERMDGSGYPSGLRGDEILLEARILAVADTIEAMASHRPYRAAIGMKDALNEVALGRGTVYDEGAAAACLEIFAEGSFSFDP